MSDAAADPRPKRTPKALAGLAAPACVACCLLPVLIAADVVGAGAPTVVGRLPALAVLASGTWWFSQRRRPCSCASSAAEEGACGCKAAADPLEITGAARR
ncbi:hypothetical protein [Streptomyces sp. NPDC005407]|uniref:hypothetical protein n=1 Tax=Streptomyces sp. NPDC005407 TaxID=3155340 RepID=UPI0033A6B799